ncbi:MAG: hypothetical protein ACJAYK_001631 [Crocinitomicaceae bacterium]|jgi:hypothetical protein
MKKLTFKAISCAAALVLSTYAVAKVSLEELMSEGVDYESETSRTVTTNSITIPLKDKPQSTIKRPVRQNTQSTVLHNFGQPLKKYPAKGKPPISRWDYAKFTVYFESGYVIHSVVKTN